jgi:hypothetical protein
VISCCIIDAANVRDQILAAIRARASAAAATAAVTASSTNECPRTPHRVAKARSSSFSGASPKDMLSVLQAQVRARRQGITNGSDGITTAVANNR